MNKKAQIGDFTEFGGVSADQWQSLYEAAVDASDNAWVPYSELAVGAAILDSDGKIFKGCNVENVTFGATVCAERTAIGNAVVDGSRNFKGLCVVTDRKEPLVPCGICRQVISEFEPAIPILLANPQGAHSFTDLETLFPEPFRTFERDDQ